MDKRLAERGIPFVVAAAGGGSHLARELLGAGGMGHVVAAFHLLNHRDRVVEQIGGTPDRFASAEAAEALAVSAAIEATRLDDRGYGVGIAAALASPGERDGRPARASLCLQTARSGVLVELGWRAGGDRAEQERAVAGYGLMLAAIGAGIYPEDPGGPVPEVKVRSALLTPGQADVLRDRRPHDRERRGGAVFCTAANPIHAGHLAIIRAAAAGLGTTVDVEIALANAGGKPLVGAIGLRDRLGAAREALAGEPVGQVYLSTLGRFADKMAFDEGVTWLVGTDTYNRIPADERWPGGGHSFLVFDRCTPDGTTIRPNRPLLPPFRAYGGEWTPSTLSSTAIRKHTHGTTKD